MEKNTELLKRIGDNLLQFMQLAFRPFRILVEAVYSFLCSLVDLLAIPVNAFSSATDYATKQSRRIDESIHRKSREKAEKQVRATIRLLLRGQDFIHASRYNSFVKIFIILGLQTVSFFTTYRGLYQCFSSINLWIPVILTFVIQVGLSYMAATVAFHHMPKGKWFLTVCFLVTSVLFSYVGVTETMLPYEDYAGQRYSSYVDEFMAAIKDESEAYPQSRDPVIVISSQYQKIGQLLSYTESIYNVQELNSAKRQKTSYQNRTYSTTVQTNGETVTTTSALDPNAIVCINDASDRVDKIKKYMLLCESIRERLASVCQEETVCATVREQMLDDNITAETKKICSDVAAMIYDCNYLAESIDWEPITLDIEILLKDYQQEKSLLALSVPKIFTEVCSDWKTESSISEQTGLGAVDTLQSLAVKSTPLALKELADEQVELSYRSAQESEMPFSKQETLPRIEGAYQQYELEHPFVYAFSQLSRKQNQLRTALIAAVIAVMNDLLAVMVGVIMSRHSINFKRSKCTRAELTEHMYAELEVAIVPIIADDLDRNGLRCTSDNIKRTFLKIMSEYMKQFSICSSLIHKGYSRYHAGALDPAYNSLTSVLLSLEMLHYVGADKMAEWGVDLSENADSKYFLMLTIRGDMWLMDLQGTSETLIPRKELCDSQKTLDSTMV